MESFANLANVNVKEMEKRKNNVNVKVSKEQRIKNLNNARHLQRKFGSVADNSLGFLRNRMS